MQQHDGKQSICPACPGVERVRRQRTHIDLHLAEAERQEEDMDESIYEMESIHLPRLPRSQTGPSPAQMDLTFWRIVTARKQ